MSELSKEVQEALQKNLPSLAAGELKAFIEKAKKIEVEHKTQGELLEKQSKQLQEQAAVDGKLDRSEITLRAAEKALADAQDKERNIELTILKNRLADKETVIGHFYAALALIAKNPRAIEIMNNSWSENQAGYPGQNGLWVYPPPITKTENKVTEHTETKD